MTNERKKIIIRSWVGTIINLLFVTSIVFAWHGELVQAGVSLIALSVVNVFYNGLPFTIFWSLSGLGLILLGYEKNAFAMGLLAIALVILAADIILWIRAIKRTGKLGLFRLKITPDRSQIYARMDFYKENEITSILWNRLMHTQWRRISATTQDEIVTRGDFENNVRVMTNDERKKVLMGLIIMIMIVSSMVCVLLSKLVLAGVLFVAVGVLNAFFMGLPFTILLIIVGLMIISFGYEKRVFGLTLVVLVFLIATANVILMHKSILSGALERFGILAKSNRFAFFDYLRENDITCILWNKLKRRLNWTETGKNRREGE